MVYCQAVDNLKNNYHFFFFLRKVSSDLINIFFLYQNFFILNKQFNLTMKSTTLTCVSVCVLLILAPTGPVQGKSLLAIMSKQAETLQHGLDLASKVGDIGKYINTVVMSYQECQNWKTMEYELRDPSVPSRDQEPLEIEVREIQSIFA